MVKLLRMLWIFDGFCCNDIVYCYYMRYIKYACIIGNPIITSKNISFYKLSVLNTSVFI